MTADADVQRLSASDLKGHAALGLAALLIFVVLHLTTGRLEVGSGAGWDGMDYSRMLRDGWSSGTVHTRLRPLIGTPDGEQQLERLNQRLLTRVERSGEAFLSNALVNGRFALRACIVNFRTSQTDIEALLPLLSRLGADLESVD